MAEGNPKDEYIDVSSNIRHWNTLRFAELTIFFALTGGLLNILFSANVARVPLASLSLKLAGLLLAVVFGILHERTMLWWFNFVRRAVELEKGLGFQQYTTRPNPGLITGTNAMRLFFIIAVIFWLASLVLFP